MKKNKKQEKIRKILSKLDKEVCGNGSFYIDNKEQIKNILNLSIKVQEKTHFKKLQILR